MTLEMIHIGVMALLVVAAVWDMRMARIPNWLVLLFLPLFALKAFLFPQDVDLLWQIVFAAVVFAAGFGLFAAGAIGAGAVKLMAATALFMPMDRLGVIGLTLLAAVIGGLILFGTLRNMFGAEDASWACLRKRIIPMAVPIAVTGVTALLLF